MMTCADGQLTVTMGRMTFIDTFGMVSVLCAVKAHVDRGYDVVVNAPTRREAGAYASRMNLHSRLRELGADVRGFPTVTHHDQHGYLVECSTFGNADDFEDLVTMLDERLAANGWPHTVILDVTEWLQEAADNLETHAQTDRGFFAAQRFPTLGALQFTVGDAGVGIPANITAANDCASIAHAMQEGVTSTDDPHRGLGFVHMQNYARNVGGWLRVRSGAGHVYVDPGKHILRSSVVERQQGTIVTAQVPVGNW